MIKRFTKSFEKILFSSDRLVCIYDLYYKNIVKREIDIARIKNSDRVLIIGGGAIPSTAINIARNTKAMVDVIDIDMEAVEKSRKLIKRLNLEDKINIDLKDALKVDSKNYDVIHVALQVTPKEEVINNVWDKSKKGSRMLIRQPKKLLKRFYSNISEEFLNRERINYEISLENKGLNTMDNLLLIIKE